MTIAESNSLATTKILLMELDTLKNVYRKSVISDGSRYENTAEHSWHLAIAFLALEKYLPQGFDLLHAMKMALTHDVCEIGAGDTCAYHLTDTTADNEEKYLKSLQAKHPEFGHMVLELWNEFEAQETVESQWVKVIDKLLPFLLNVSTDWQTWQEQGITKDMVIENNRVIGAIAPAVYDWILNELDNAVDCGWIT